MTMASSSSRREVADVLRGFRSAFVVVGIFSLVSNLLMLVPTIYMLQVYDRVLHSGSLLTLLAVSLLTLFLLAVMAFAEWARSYLLVRIGIRLDKVLSPRVFSATFESCLRQSNGDPSRPLGDLLQLRQFLTGAGIFALFDVPWIPIYIGVTFLLHPWLGALAVVFAAMLLALGWYSNRLTAPAHELSAKHSAEADRYLQSKLVNAEVVETLGMLGHLRKHWEDRHRAYLASHAQAQQKSNSSAALTKFVRYSQQSLSLGAGALLVIDGALSAGSMIAGNVLMTRALAPIEQLVGAWRGFTTALKAYRRLEDTLTAFPDRDAAGLPGRPSGHIQLEDILASADGREEPILDQINLTLTAGSVTVVLGPSGSGKSTLARVLIGIWPDWQGRVLLDSTPITNWRREDLGPHIGYLPQDIELFEGTIADNIGRFGDVDPDQVIAAAQATGLHDAILRLPKGYDTQIGEAGSLLSAGQRQRIGLARAVYASPAIVVLDEPNANLDDAGEAALLKTVEALKAQKTTVVLITHRSGILSAADHLLVLRNGRVGLFGPRDEVLARMRPASSPPHKGIAAGTTAAAGA